MGVGLLAGYFRWGGWPLHGVIGTWGGIAAGIFGQPFFGGMGGASFFSQLAGSLLAVIYALLTSAVVYFLISRFFGFRLEDEAQLAGADLSIHHIGAYPGRTSEIKPPGS